MGDGWIGVDLDGTLAHYDHGTFDAEHVGAPVPAMLERVKRWVDGGVEVRIVTARVSGPPAEARIARAAIQAWCQEHVGMVLDVTCRKGYAMLELYDDRAVTVEMNTGRLLAPSSRGFGDES